MDDMPKNEAPLSVGIQISGTFDIALARQHLRKLSEELDWSPTFRMRATAAFTALAEIAHFKDRQHQGPSVVYVQVLEQNTIQGVEFHADANLEMISREYPVARWQLERVSDELDVEEGKSVQHIVMRVWANGK
jgi:hypothetical protein